MDERQRAYLELLTHGLIAIRNYSYDGQMSLCEIESDHLHNIPSLFEESNELRHHYYIVQERGLYLERLESLGATEYLKSLLSRYAQPWKILSSIAGVNVSGGEAKGE